MVKYHRGPPVVHGRATKPTVKRPDARKATAHNCAAFGTRCSKQFGVMRNLWDEDRLRASLCTIFRVADGATPRASYLERSALVIRNNGAELPSSWVRRSSIWLSVMRTRRDKDRSVYRSLSDDFPSLPPHSATCVFIWSGALSWSETTCPALSSRSIMKAHMHKQCVRLDTEISCLVVTDRARLVLATYS
jgi:hypothetical protein